MKAMDELILYLFKSQVNKIYTDGLQKRNTNFPLYLSKDGCMKASFTSMM